MMTMHNHVKSSRERLKIKKFVNKVGYEKKESKQKLSNKKTLTVEDGKKLRKNSRC